MFMLALKKNYFQDARTLLIKIFNIFASGVLMRENQLLRQQKLL